MEIKKKTKKENPKTIKTQTTTHKKVTQPFPRFPPYFMSLFLTTATIFCNTEFRDGQDQALKKRERERNVSYVFLNQEVKKGRNGD